MKKKVFALKMVQIAQKYIFHIKFTTLLFDDKFLRSRMIFSCLEIVKCNKSLSFIETEALI